MRNLILLFLTIVGLSTSSMEGQANSNTYIIVNGKKVHKSMKGYSQSGIASFYGYESSGKTASGEIFNPKNLTAAHNYLPFGTLVRVSSNNKSIVVRINDRGPAKRLHRVIDLSKQAARVLGIKGLAEVKIEALT